MRNVELLAPAGNLEKLETVLHFGADAAYLGLSRYNLRAFADNFSEDDLLKGVALAHSLGRRVYATLNIIPFNSDLDTLPESVRFLERAGVDAVIVSDLGLFELVREVSSLPVHVSTQASNTNWRSVRMWQKLGAKRVILARELPLDEIRRIRDANPDVEIETFVHGAMCIAFSGHCLLSAVLAGRDANNGGCVQSCRWRYHLVEQTRPGELHPVLEDERGTYIFNSRDLCTVAFLRDIIDAGVDSLKIEGRVKGIYYAAVTTKVYREALEACRAGDHAFREEWLHELGAASNRGFTSGFYFGRNTPAVVNADASEYFFTRAIAAKVLEVRPDGEFLVGFRNPTERDMPLEILAPEGRPQGIEVLSFREEESGLELSRANPNQRVLIRASHTPQPGDLLRQVRSDGHKTWNPNVQKWVRGKLTGA